VTAGPEKRSSLCWRVSSDLSKPNLGSYLPGVDTSNRKRERPGIEEIIIEGHVTRQHLAYMISIALVAILLAAVLLFSDMVYWHLRA
jgi:hypothetical protein